MQPIDDSKPRLKLRLIYVWIILFMIIGFCLQFLPRTYSEKRFANKALELLYYPVLWQTHARDNLQRDYKEVFDTPFESVRVDEYTNSKGGHGTLFFMALKSSVPLQLKNLTDYKLVSFDSPEATYSNEDGRFAKNHAPWITTCLYKHKPAPERVYLNGQLYEKKAGQLEDPDTAPQDVWVYFNDAKDTSEVYAR